MSSAADQLIALMEDADPYAHPRSEVVPFQVRALDERLAERRSQIRVLHQRAADVGTAGITRLDDVIPLLFAHTSYKSYPESFVSEGRWDRLLLWLGTLSAQPIGQVDLTGVTDIDDWMLRLHDVSHHVVCSSGTSGKCSLLDQSPGDLDTTGAIERVNMRWALGIEPAQDRPAFLLGPSRGPHRFVDAFRIMGSLYGRPGAVHFLSDRPASAAEGNRLGSLRRAIAEGRATPSQITELEAFAAERQKEMTESLNRLVEAICDHRGEPMIIFGMWAQHWLIMELARARGVGDGEFHPDTAIIVGGGLKGAVLPDGFERQIAEFYGLPPGRFQNAYGMAEMTSFWFPSCPAGRHHLPPWVVPLVLDKAGERLLNPRPGDGGVVDGRMALFDLTTEARWGGLITGDNVTVDFSACACGRPGPAIHRIARYMDLPEGDDKLTCAGTMDSYVRGVMS